MNKTFEDKLIKETMIKYFRNKKRISYRKNTIKKETFICPICNKEKSVKEFIYENESMDSRIICKECKYEN